MKPVQRFLLCTLAANAAGTYAQTVDLVTHNGFEACWSHALTETAFLQFLQSSIEGLKACVPPTSGTFNAGFGDINYSACNSLGCANNTALGCEVTLHSGAFTGAFGTNDASFSAPGSADNVSGPLTFSGALSGNCTVTVSNITLTYEPDFYVTPDGNLGDYMAYLTAATTVTINSDDISVSGADFSCAVANSYAGFVKPTINTDAESAATTQLTGMQAGESVCPLTP